MISGGSPEVSPTSHAIAGPESGVREKCVYARPVLGMCGAQSTRCLMIPARRAVLPTKTSLSVSNLLGVPIFVEGLFPGVYH